MPGFVAQNVSHRCHQRSAVAHCSARLSAEFIYRRDFRARASHRGKGRRDDRCRRQSRPARGRTFAVKNLFDIEGLPTRAGSKINRDRAASSRDATLIERLEAVGAVLVGALNMGEYAYDFTGENVHDGPSRNPHDLTRMAGGSSGGSGSSGWRRTRTAGTWLRHQWIDPRTIFILRHLWLKADLRQTVARAIISVCCELRSSRPVLRERPEIWRSLTMQCRGLMRTMPRVWTARSSR